MAGDRWSVEFVNRIITGLASGPRQRQEARRAWKPGTRLSKKQMEAAVTRLCELNLEDVTTDDAAFEELWSKVSARLGKLKLEDIQSDDPVLNELCATLLVLEDQKLTSDLAKPVLGLLAHPNTLVRYHALSALRNSELDEPQISDVIPCLEDASHIVRKTAPTALQGRKLNAKQLLAVGKIRNPGARSVLEKGVVRNLVDAATGRS